MPSDGMSDHVAAPRSTLRPVREGEWVRFVLHFDVLDAARFRAMAEAMVAVALEEPGTLVYDWYLDEARDAARLYEAYASLEALQASPSAARCSPRSPRSTPTRPD